MTVSLLYALYPAPYFLAAVLTNQHIAAFFYYLGFWMLVRRDRLSPLWAVGAGLCLAVGNVMRPLGAVIVLALLCWTWCGCSAFGGMGVLRLGAPFLAAGVAYFISTELFDWLVRATGLNPEGLANNLPLWKFVLGFNLESGGAWNQADYNAYYLLPRGQASQAMEAGSGPAAFLPRAGGLSPAVLEKEPDHVGVPGVPVLGLRPPERRGSGAGRADPGPVLKRPELLGQGGCSCWPLPWGEQLWPPGLSRAAARACACR